MPSFQIILTLEKYLEAIGYTNVLYMVFKILGDQCDKQFQAFAMIDIHAVPGPGTYAHSSFTQMNKSHHKGFSMRPHVNDLDAMQRSKMPGPGHYDSHLKNKHSAPKYSYGTNKRSTFIDFSKQDPNPPPGTHQPKTTLRFRSISSYTFSNSPRRNLYENQKTPGPGNYEERKLKVLPAAPKFSVTKSLAHIEEFMGSQRPNPSPDQYNPKFTLVKEAMRNTFTTTESRPDFEKQRLLPGPGQYNPHESSRGPTWRVNTVTNPRCIIGTTPRKVDFVQIHQAVPGPGTYTHDNFTEMNKTHHKGFSMRPHVNDLEAMQRQKVPGPGHYDSHLKNKHSAPKYGYGTNKRSTFIDISKQDTNPPPGTHDPKNTLRHRSVSSYTFSNSPRKSLYENQKTPGPGNYEERKLKVLPAAPKFSVTKSLAHIEEFMGSQRPNPSPDHYNPKYTLVKQAMRRTFTTTENRPDFQKHKLLPGPGHYNHDNNKKGPKWSFGYEKRINFTEQVLPKPTASRSPGPANYSSQPPVEQTPLL